MRLEEIVGNVDAVRALKGMAETGRVPNALMLYENDGCGAIALALAFLDALFNHDHKVSAMIHPDVHYVYPVASGSKVSEKQENLKARLFLPMWRELMAGNPYSLESEVSAAFGIEGKQAVINVAEAREILDNVYLSSVEGGYKAVVIYLPEKMNASAANALLKVIEEPPEKTVFVMVTHAPEKVTQTISSRCQAMRVQPCSKEDLERILTASFGKSEAESAEASLVCGGSVGEALAFLSDREDYKEQMAIFEALMSALYGRNLTAALDCGDKLAAMPSREKQKAFCKFAGDCLRKIFLLQQGLPQIAGVAPDEREFFATAADRCKKVFPRMAMECIDRARLMLERNVNPKIVSCDLVNRLYKVF